MRTCARCAKERQRIIATELPPAKAGGLAQSGATTKVVNRTCLNAHESTHEGQSHRLKPVVFTKCVDNKAETLERQYGQLSMTVLRPEQNTQDAIRRLRAVFMRRCLTPAGIWTIETGTQFAGLHVNILSQKPLPARWKNCEAYSELLRCTSRDAAAYISKRSGMPALEQYAGRLYGTFGQIGEILASKDAAPVVQAASIEISLSGNTPTMPKNTSNDEEITLGELDTTKPPFFNKNYPELCNPPILKQQLSLEHRREIMRRNLPNIYASISRQQPQVPIIERDWALDVL